MELGKKILFIYNPNAGKELIKSKLSDIVETFNEALYEVTIYATQSRKDATNIVIERGNEFDLVICSGGDGTLNEVTDGLMQLENRPPCGYIPAGTVNDFASTLGISKNMKKAAEEIIEGELFAYDIGSLNGDYFNYIAAFGAFTDVSYETPQFSKNILGRLAYVLEGMKRLPAIQSYHVSMEIDDEVVEDDIIFGMITNSISVGGFKGYTGKNVKLDDGLFEVSLIKSPKNPIELQVMMNALLLKEFDNKYFYFFRTARIRVLCEEEISWTLDGEFGGSFQDSIIQNHPKAIRFVRTKSDLLELPDYLC